MANVNFNNEIPQNTLWDNLKRKANVSLREIEALSLIEKVNVFNNAPHKRIQKLLNDIGEHLYKIVLHQVLLTEIGDYEKNTLAAKKIDDIIKDFSFFFYPGYVTLEHKNRIFIEGARVTGDNKQRRFFSGVGGKKVRLNKKLIDKNNIGNLINFLNADPNLLKPAKPIKCFNTNSLFYTDNISTLIYNLCLNQFYFDNDYPEKGTYPYQVGSTQMWKSQQVYNGQYIPLKLKKDGSELRILHIGAEKKEHESELLSGNNMISILIDEKSLNKSGEIVAHYLSKTRIPIEWKEEKHREAYLDWCNVQGNASILPETVKDNELYEAQRKAYSFWISETFGGNGSYEEIQSFFTKLGYKFIAKNRIKSSDDFLKENPEYLEKIERQKFKNWYTLFLESFGENVDLGTVMFLSNHRLDSRFLNYCANFIRWIYNELRLIEATAVRQVSDFRAINHHQNKVFFALKNYIQNIKEIKKTSKIALNYYVDTLEGFMTIEEFFQTKSSRFTRLGEVSNVNIVTEIENMYLLYQELTKNKDIFFSTFTKINIKEIFFVKYQNLNFLDFNLPENVGKYNVKCRVILLRLILKDLIENLITHAELGFPKGEIIVDGRDNLSITFCNNQWVTDEVLKKMSNNGFSPRHKGWDTINKVCNLINKDIESTNVDIVLPKNKTDKLVNSELFWIKIIFRNG